MRAQVKTNGHGWSLMLVPENVQEQVALDHTMQRLEKERLSADVSNFITKVEVMLKLLPKLEGGT